MPRMAQADLAQRLHAASHVVGRFKLRSGQYSDQYFDKYGFESDPALLADLGDELAALVPEGVDMLAGLELGGIPIATILSQRTGLPLAFVRKEAKSYGTCKQVEGADPRGRRVAIVEDVVTSGGAILDALGPLREAGAEVVAAICAIDREAGAAEALEAEGVSLHAGFRMSALMDAVSA
jgi:orotate phosphoribosyltransferase